MIKYIIYSLFFCVTISTFAAESEKPAVYEDEERHPTVQNDLVQERIAIVRKCKELLASLKQIREECENLVALNVVVVDPKVSEKILEQIQELKKKQQKIHDEIDELYRRVKQYKKQ